MEKRIDVRTVGIGVTMLIAAVLAIITSRTVDVQATLQTVLEWISNLGAWAALVFVLAYVTATVLFVPGVILTMGAGFLFGLIRGVILASIASTTGAGIAFLVGRYLARDWVSEKIRRYPKFHRIDEAIGREGWRIVGLVRLSPVFPFNLLNYAFGLTRVRLRDYLLASWIGCYRERFSTFILARWPAASLH